MMITSVQSNLANGRIACSKVPLSVRNLNPNLTHGFLDPHESAAQTASRSVFAGLICMSNTQTDRHTDTQTTLRATSVAISRI